MQEDQQIIIILVVIFSVCLFSFGVFFFILINKYYKNLNSKQNEALNNIIIGQDNERSRIARDLHDEMGPTLSNIIFKIDEISNVNTEAVKITENIKADLNQAIKRIRQISHNLMPQSLKKYGLIDTLKDLVYHNPYSNFTIQFASNVDTLNINEVVKLNIFNIIQELLYNTNKHSQATVVKLNLNYNDLENCISINYSDNGLGHLNKINNYQGIGIKNILTRVHLLNGSIKILSNDGYDVKIKLYLQKS